MTDFYPPHKGGLEQHVKALAEHLALRGHEVAVATTARSSGQSEAEQTGVPVHCTPGLSSTLPFLNRDPRRRFPLPGLDPLLYRGLRKLVTQVRPDVIHAHGWSTFTALHLDLPVVATLHDYGLVCPKRTLLRGDRVCDEGPGFRCIECGKEQYGLAKSAAILALARSGKWSLQRARAYIAVSSFVRDAHLRFTNLPPSQIVVIPNFYCRTEEDENQEALELSLPTEFILFVGYLARYKGVHVLLEAYRRLHMDVPLVLIGYPVESLRVTDPRIRVIEGAPHADVMRALARCLFAVVPSVVPDSLPTVALEAMSQGKAVVASSIGGLPDVVLPGQTGILTPASDAAALARGMAALLDDHCLRQRLGEAGQRRVHEEFSADVVVPRIEEVYRRVM